MKNSIELFAKYAGIATICAEWLALLLYYLQLPSYFGGKYPISYYDTLPQTRFVFTICYTLAGIFCWIFVRYHLRKYAQVPMKLFALSMILFIGVALLPLNPANAASNLIHGILSWSSGILFAVSMYIFAKNSKDKLVYRVLLTVVVVSALFIAAFALSPKNSPFIFAFEAGSWLVWQLWVLWISYYSYRYNLG